jgi:subtilisin family serine protease
VDGLVRVRGALLTVAGVAAALVAAAALVGAGPAAATPLAAAGPVAAGPVAAGPVAAGPAAATPGPPSAPEYWFDSWRVPALWADGARGQGVTIAEIDTGVNASLPELAGRVLKGKDFGLGGDGRVDREVDAFGHGTAMASIMVARPGLLGITGLAPDARIRPVAVPLRGTTDAGRPDKLAAAIRWAADSGAKIISMSLGGKRSPKYDTQPCSDDEQAAVYHALRKGALVLAAVGNTGPTRNAVEDPGVCLGVVAVGAVDAAGHVAAFSTRQPYVTLVAPGVSVPSLGRVAGQAYSGNGTSQATAIASAVAALVWSKHPRLTATQVTARILATLDGRRRVPSASYGYGRLDAYRAVTAAVPADAADPVAEAVAPFLARDRALAAAQQQRAPAPAATRAHPAGSVAVGTAPAVTGKVVTGAAVGGSGLTLLAALLVVGRRGRRRRLAAFAAGLPGTPDPDPAPSDPAPPPRL